MKRILFYSENFCGEKTKGGLEVATYRIADAIKNSSDWEVYNAYRRNKNEQGDSIYKKVVRLGTSKRVFEKKLKEFLKENDIDVVVNMSRFFSHEYIFKAFKSTGRYIKVVFMQHFAPGSEMKKPTFKAGFHLLKLNPYNPLYWIRCSIYPLVRLPRRLRFSKVYKDTYNSSDKVILLSEGYKEDYCKIGNFIENTKFVSIPNIFEEGREDPYEKKNKKKEKFVLFLSRMDEIQKRMSLALKIWAKVEEDTELNDWHLDIVGSGHNVDILKRWIKKLKLQHVTYHGWQDRKKFLERSSILMSTSEYEGLPLSVLEAQANGVVPVSFNSYSSIQDAITPFENGVLVEEFGDIDDYVKKLKDLMYDHSYREELSRNAIVSVERFSKEKIGDKWIKMLASL